MEIKRISLDSEIIECLKIYNYYIKNTSASLEENEVKEEDYIKKISLINEKYPVFVCKDDNSVIGFSYLDEFNYRSAYKITSDLTVYIKEEYKGKGIGKALYKRIEEEAKEMDIENIVSLITASNTSSIEFHKRMGFSVIGTLENVAKKNGNYESLTYMMKKIK